MKGINIAIAITIALIMNIVVFSICYAAEIRHFRCTVIDHFSPGDRCIEEQKDKKENHQKQTEKIIKQWGEPTINERGEMVYRIPPRIVLNLLMEPNEQNAREYMRWSEKRMQSLQAAQEAIARVNNAQIEKDNIKTVHFYFSPHCPYSVMQAPIIRQISSVARVIGYPVSGDASSIAAFMQNSGLNIQLSRVNNSPESNVSSVPLTIIETTDGQMRRFAGYTVNFNIKGITPAAVQPGGVVGAG